MEASHKKMKKSPVFLLLILLLAVFLRFYGLGTENIWMDEAFAIQSSTEESVPAVVSWVKEFDPIPPLYYVTLHFWVNLFGSSEFVIRSLSVLFNLLTLPVFFIFVKRLFNNKTALIASLLFATSMLQVQYSQEARSYAMFSFLVWLSCLLFLKIAVDKKNYIIPYVVVSALAIYTTQLMLFVMFIQALAYVLLTKREKIKQILFSQGVVVLLFAPWLPTLYEQFFLVNRLFQLNFINRFHLPAVIGVLGVFWFVIAFLILLGIFFFLYFRKQVLLKKLINERLFLASAAVLFVGYVVTLPFLIKSFFLVRYFFFALPLAYLFIAFGTKIIKNNKLKCAVVAAFVLLNCLALYTYYSEPTKPEWRQAVAFVDGSAAAGEAVVFDTGYSKIIYDYYGGKLPAYGLIKRNADVNDSEAYVKKMIPELKQKKGVWLTLYRNFVTKDFYRKELSKELNLTDSRDFFEIKVYHFKQP